MENSRFVIQKRRLFFGIMCFAFCVSAICAQSTRIEYPTPITANEITGRINARDIGDSRLTTYYYVFNGTQGDIFLKIQATNLNGDIDVFYAENLRPLTKISLYADAPVDTGREIYLRKPEKLILRVEGRSPNDDPATFSIKFDGSFQALAASDAASDADAPRVKSDVSGAVRVNSVGTIIEPERKPEPEETVAAAAAKPSKKTAARKTVSTGGEKDENKDAEEENLNRKRVADAEKSADEKTGETPAKKTATTRTKTPARRPARTAPAKRATAKAPAKPKPPVERKTPPAPTKSAAELKAEELATALENVRLVVLMKNGDKLDRPMSDVLRFSVDKGTLTIISKKGAITRYSILDVAKVSIE